MAMRHGHDHDQYLRREDLHVDLLTHILIVFILF